MSSPENVPPFPPLANSDHLGLHIELDLKPTALPNSSRPRARAIWRYRHADFTLAKQRIRDTNWDEFLSDDIDSAWLGWQDKFLEIMEECIPRKVLPPRRRNLPWLNKSIINPCVEETPYSKERKAVITTGIMRSIAKPGTKLLVISDLLKLHTSGSSTQPTPDNFGKL